MKKFFLGTMAGLALYKIVRSKAVANRIRTHVSKFGRVLTDAVIEKIIDRAVKNGMTDEEFETFMRILTKAVQ